MVSSAVLRSSETRNVGWAQSTAWQILHRLFSKAVLLNTVLDQATEEYWKWSTSNNWSKPGHKQTFKYFRNVFEIGNL